MFRGRVLPFRSIIVWRCHGYTFVLFVFNLARRMSLYQWWNAPAKRWHFVRCVYEWTPLWFGIQHARSQEKWLNNIHLYGKTRNDSNTVATEVNFNEFVAKLKENWSHLIKATKKGKRIPWPCRIGRTIVLRNGIWTEWYNPYFVKRYARCTNTYGITYRMLQHVQESWTVLAVRNRKCDWQDISNTTTMWGC